MVLKWASAMVAAIAAGSFVTMAVTTGARAPLAVALALVAICAAGAVLVVIAELYQRLDARLGVLADFLVVRLDEIVARLDRLEATPALDALFDRSEVDRPGFGRTEPAPVVSLVPRRGGR
jgi:predicted signal transduction protein with EAL and GGDEF domain